MTEIEAELADPKTKKSKLPLALSLALALVGGGAGFYLSWSGMIMGPGIEGAEVEGEQVAPIDDVVYVAIDPLVISLPQPAQARHLRFRAQIEVPTQYSADVEKLLPRVTDVLNGYLRAVKIDDLEDPSILIRLRSQMLHRIKIVVGDKRARDLLIMEFVFT